MKNIFIIPIEPVSTRYTGQWYDHIPVLFRHYANQYAIECNITSIDGGEISDNVTPGAFLDFGGTNIWKSRQLEQIADKFKNGEVKEGDVFVYTDAWNPTVIQLKYMSELLKIPVKIIGLWHAGSYDPQDFLGRLIGNTPWVRHAEKSMFDCYDVNAFATDFHIDMFCDAIYRGTVTHPKIIRTGWPMEYMESVLKPFANLEKKNQIVFPHRKAPEKQLDIFLDLAKELPEYQWVVCQDKKLSKDEYHTILGESKIVFSANLQETLGIGTCAEGPLVNAIPLAPDRLSYTEIFKNLEGFLYPSEWTESYDSYLQHKDKMIDKIKSIMNNYEKYKILCNSYNDHEYRDYFHAKNLLNEVFK